MAGDLAHRHRIETFGVRDRQRRLRELLPGESGPTCPWFRPRPNRGVVLRTCHSYTVPSIVFIVRRTTMPYNVPITGGDMKLDAEVLIAGAGPTGLLLACELARRGVSFRLVDQSTAFFGGSRGDGLMPRTQEVFADMGVLPTVLAAGGEPLPTRIYDGDQVIWEGSQAETYPPTADVPYPNPYFVPQYRTEQILRDRLAELGGTLEQGVTLVDLTHLPDEVVVGLLTRSGPQRARFRYVVGADGGKSTVRKACGIPFTGETDEGTTMTFGDVRLSGLDRSHGRIWRYGDSFVSLVPLHGTDRFNFTIPVPVLPADTSLLEHLQDLVSAASGDPGIVLQEITWSTTWRANARIADRFRERRVFLAGDAAHVCPPTGGQGMNTGIQDAYNLAWKLAAVLGGAHESLLDSYEQERRPAAEAALDLSGRLLAKYKNGDADANVRSREVHQLGINYRTGSLAEDRRAQQGSLIAGDRAPDGRTETGKTVFDLLAGPHWTVLQVSDGTGTLGFVLPEYPEIPVYTIDPDVWLKFGITAGTTVLIRPDNHIAVCVTEDAHQAIVDYLQNRIGLSAITTSPLSQRTG
ncbi:hypothetical protein D5S17_02715 [Pseudonocardiaceae bacterium YIM PH 21723]|nr:hypothetical protein D5S17_02715 [Pseudonocardiaceae bacterium YIM PH 21723]